MPNRALSALTNLGHIEATRLTSAISPIIVGADTTGAIVTTNATAPTIANLADVVANANAGGPSWTNSDASAGVFSFQRREGTIGHFRFFGVGSDGNTGSAYIIGWDAMGCDRGTYADLAQLTPVYVGSVDFTLGSKTGVANGILTASHKYADTISVTRQGSMPPNQIRVVGLAAGGDNGICDIAVDMLDFVAATVYLTKGTCTSVGVAHRMMSGS